MPGVSIDALTSSTLKYLRERWWDDTFTAFLAETLRPRVRRVLDEAYGLADAALAKRRLLQLAAGLDGVERKLTPPDPVDKNIFELSIRERRKYKIRELPRDLGEAVKLLRATLPAFIDMRVQLDPESPWILSDLTSLYQVIINLVTNSSHAMPHGGMLEIITAPFYVSDSIARAHPELREGWYGLLEIRDTGQGMEPEIVERVFDPFFTTKGPGVGTGLGLSMVYAIMRDHDGIVELQSTLGRGTVVRCLFPAIEADLADAIAEEAALPPGDPASGCCTWTTRPRRPGSGSTAWQTPATRRPS